VTNASSNVRNALLRHRFESIAQLKAHLHVVDGRSLLFFRDPALELPAGAEVRLEMTLANSEQTRVVRASLVARSEGLGLWLAMSDTRFARDVHDRGLLPRRGRRLEADRPVRVRRVDGSEYLVTLLDLSVVGARIGGGLPRSLSKGSELEVRCAFLEVGQPAELGRATVMWVDAGEAGLQFDRSTPASRVSVAKLFQSLQKEWEKARTIDHLPGCCVGGALLDPPLPRLRFDGKDDVSRSKIS
jgi:PilZ domain